MKKSHLLFFGIITFFVLFSCDKNDNCEAIIPAEPAFNIRIGWIKIGLLCEDAYLHQQCE